jgi:hypothetical protein
MPDYGMRSQELVFSTVERLAAASRFVARAIEIAGNVASYSLWQQVHGLSSPRFFGREALWRSTMFPRLKTSATVLEFGVAQGAATQYWLAHLDSPDLQWHGFDVFTGLPTAWTRGGVQYSAAGRFDAGGVPPAIDDPRVTWHVGLVQETLPAFDVDPNRQLCVLIDLDLYEPSAFALRWLTGRLRAGDLLYLDEIYDPWHERKALDEFLDSGHRLRLLGSTGMAAAFEYVE